LALDVGLIARFIGGQAKIMNEISCHQFLVSRELGGAGLTALHMARFLQENGRQSSVWIPGDGPAAQEAERLGLKVRLYRASWALSPRKLKAAVENWRIGRVLRRQQGDIIHVHSPGHYGGLRWGLRFSGAKTIVHVQIEETSELLRWAFRQPPTLIITCAHFLVDHVRRALPDVYQERQKIVAVPNAVDTRKFWPGDKAAAKARIGAPAGIPLVLMLANLAPHKGQETAIHAMALLKQRRCQVTCWLAGIERGGVKSYTERLHSFIEEMGVSDRVRLLGARNDAPDLLRAADFLLLPSTCEGLPLSILEAQATKVPVLATCTAGIPEVVRHGETGFLIPAEDAGGYATCLVNLLKSPRLYDRIAENAYRLTTLEHNWATLCRRIWDLYRELVGLRGPTPLHRPGLYEGAVDISQERTTLVHGRTGQLAS
jgi:glycosyltransferase involved in cell wall biosynthesis